MNRRALRPKDMLRDSEYECQEMQRSGEFEYSEISARRTARAAELHDLRGDPNGALWLATTALAEFPMCIDALRVRCMTTCPRGLSPIASADATICSLRETLSLAREFVRPALESGKMLLRLRPLVRLLNDFAHPFIMTDRIEVSIHALEECLRVDPDDLSFAHESLLFCYLKVIGRRHRREVCFIERDEHHVNALIQSHFMPNDGEYNDDSMSLRWAELIMSYKKGGTDWHELARREEQYCPWIMRFLFDEIRKIVHYDAADNDIIQHDANRICEKLAVCLFDWPKLFTEMYTLLRGSRNIVLEMKAHNMACSIFARMCREGRRTRSNIGRRCIDQGRVDLSGGNYFKGLLLFSLAHKCFADIVRPGVRWNLVTPYEISSNRALAAERLHLWNMCRIDTRATLSMKHDHLRAYARLPAIFHAFDAYDLEREMNIFLQHVTNYANVSPGEWRRRSLFAVSMLSPKAIVLSKMGRLTIEKREELTRVGDDDMYSTINSDVDLLDNLAWLENADLDV